MDRVAAQAGKAAPAVAIAGALVTAPQLAHAATVTAGPIAASAAVHQTGATAAGPAAARSAAKAALDSVTARSTSYKVRPGDTLSKIAGDIYHKSSDWQWIYHENQKRISDPDAIYPGQTLYVPADAPANYTLPTSYLPRHAKPAAAASASESGGDGVMTQSARASASSGSSAGMSGTLGCSGLERLWDAAGGNAGDAQTAASVAMAESGGNQYAVSPTNDYGYWQINASNGSLATFDPYGNARAAIQLSDNGSNWTQWTTYTSGAYSGRC